MQRCEQESQPRVFSMRLDHRSDVTTLAPCIDQESGTKVYLQNFDKRNRRQVNSTRHFNQHMDVVYTFNHELRSLLDHKPPISKTKMGLVTKAAMRAARHYKHIVHSVEKFVAKCRPEHKLPGLYVIDSIVRQSRHQFGADRDVFAARFTRNITTTFDNLLTACPPSDRSRIVRVLHLWEKNGVFELNVIRSLLEMAARSMSGSLAADPKSPSSGDTLNSAGREHYLTHQNNRPNTNAGDALKFSKNMLDFDYGEEDGDADETPTEAEPPLSSTLSKLEMEQRPRRYTGTQQAGRHDTGRLLVNKDPVLERWNRIWKGDPSGTQPPISNNYLTTRRSRSKSPSAMAQRSYSSNSKQHKPEVPRTDAGRASNGTSRSRGDTTRRSSDRASERDRDRDRDRGRDRNRDRERDRERDLKGLPKNRKSHLTVCSSTLWLGHIPRSVTEANISDVFGEFGTINSIDLIPPRGCAYICMDRRQDAKRALRESRHLNLNGSHIKMAWAPGKGLKEHRKLIDFWDANVGASFIPYTKIDDMIDFDRLEEGGLIDEASMSSEMRRRRERRHQEKGDYARRVGGRQASLDAPLPNVPIFNQPPPSATFSLGPSPLGMPPPLLIGGEGVIPFPPPGLNLASSSHVLIPPPPMFAQSSSGVLEHRDHEFDPAENQLGIIGRQLSELPQGQETLSQQNIRQLFTSPGQQNPMMFDARSHPLQMLHMMNPLLDPHSQIALADRGQLHRLMGGAHPALANLGLGGPHEPASFDESHAEQGPRGQ